MELGGGALPVRVCLLTGELPDSCTIGVLMEASSRGHDQLLQLLTPLPAPLHSQGSGGWGGKVQPPNHDLVFPMTRSHQGAHQSHLVRKKQNTRSPKGLWNEADTKTVLPTTSQGTECAADLRGGHLCPTPTPCRAPPLAK